MKLFTPDCYSQFHCIASACPDCCCQEWEIDIDPHTMETYSQLSGQLGQKIRRHIKVTPDGPVIAMENGKCAMWRKDGLCEIQVQLGHDALCQVCREFPRIHHDYGDFMELGLELSCPEAARLLLTVPYEVHESQIPGGSDPEYDPVDMAVLQRTRHTALNFLRTTSLPPEQALAVLLFYGYGAQAELDGGDSAVLSPEQDLEKVQSFASAPSVPQFLEFFKALEILTPQWEERLKHPPVPSHWQPAHLALARYMVTRYWYQAVSDFDLVSRVKFSVIACILVRLLGADPVATAQLFSKEIENDADNVDAILDGCFTSPALTDQHLLGLLLHL